MKNCMKIPQKIINGERLFQCLKICSFTVPRGSMQSTQNILLKLAKGESKLIN